MNKQTRRISTRRLVTMSVLAALAVVLLALVRFPIFPAMPFLEYDPADIPIFIGTFAFGPVMGLLITLVASVIQGLTVSAGSGVYGILMHILATGTFVLVAGLIYRRFNTRKGAAIALIAGVIAWVAVMIPANLLITPAFTGLPREQIGAWLLPYIIPFNLIKAGGNALVTFLIYKPLSRLIRREPRAARTPEREAKRAIR